LAPAGVAGDPTLLAQGGEVVPAGEQLVHVGLVTSVEDDRVPGAVEDPVQGQAQFHDPEIGAQVSSGAGDRVDQEGPDLLGEVEQLLGGQPFEVGWPGDGAKQTHDASAPFLRGRDHRVYDQPPSGAVWPTGSSPG